jgi:hypothetical protein
MSASNVERVLLQEAMPDDGVALYSGPAVSAQAQQGLAGQRTFWRIAMIEEPIVLNGSATVNLTTSLPKGAVPLSAHLNFDTTITFAGGATKIGFGRASAITELALSASGIVAKNTKTDNSLVSITESVTVAVPIQINATNDAGAQTGTATGTVRARVIYRYAASIPDAA